MSAPSPQDDVMLCQLDQETRDELLLEYLDQLPFEPYPVQEQALLAYFASKQGIMLCAPTGTGKTLIAEAALFEALSSSQQAYYTTPLIALTDQKFEEVTQAAVRWGFDADQVGLVTGNRSVNPHAPIKVVVAEVLLNRLLSPGAFDFDHVGAVVMDEFHTFNEPERGMVWEMTLSLLPKHVRLMLLSATVGNAYDFLKWLRVDHGRDLDLVQGTERKVPLTYHWVEDRLLQELVADMAQADSDHDETRRTPALVFCFDRERCWSTAEMLHGKPMVSQTQQAALAKRLDEADLTGGIGPKLKKLLMRGVGVHHAGVLPKHRRLVETLFQERLLSVCVCTETLAAGMNLPARSVVLTDLLKGPVGNKKLIATGQAQQMFGRAGRPQFDTQGHVYAVAHEDDVKIFRHKEKIAQIPEDTKDPGLMAMRKKLMKKAPRRREGFSYWSQAQFEKLQTAEPAKLASKGHLPWRLLAYLLDQDPSVKPLQDQVNRRLMTEPEKHKSQAHLTDMLLSLEEGGFVELDPISPPQIEKAEKKRRKELAEAALKDGESEELIEGSELVEESNSIKVDGQDPVDQHPNQQDALDIGGLLSGLTLGGAMGGGLGEKDQKTSKLSKEKHNQHNPKAKTKQQKKNEQHASGDEDSSHAIYVPVQAKPTPKLQTLLSFRAVHPLYGAWLLKHLAYSEKEERIQVLESLLEVPGSVARRLRPPKPEDLAPGPLAHRIDPLVLQAGLASYEQMYPPPVYEQDLAFGEKPKFPIPLAEKLKMLFESQVPHAGRLPIMPVWAVGDLLNYDGDFNQFITVKELAKQEGVVFKHCLRMILLCQELMAVVPEYDLDAEIDPSDQDEAQGTNQAQVPITVEQWHTELSEIEAKLTQMCSQIDPQSTEEALAQHDDAIV